MFQKHILLCIAVECVNQNLLPYLGHLVRQGRLDRLVHLWDAQDGQELLSLAGHGPSGVFKIAFSRDGQRLVSVGNDHTVKVWEVASADADLQRHREAGQLAQALFDQLIRVPAVIDHLHHDVGYSEELRREALALAAQHHHDPDHRRSELQRCRHDS